MKTSTPHDSLPLISNDPRAEDVGLNQLFRDFLKLAREVGFAKAAAAWVNGQPVGSLTNPGGAITVIPSKGESCTPLVLVLIGSWTGHPPYGGRLDRDQELDALSLHLVLCEKVKGVAIISDVWHREEWSEYWGQFTEAWSRRGIVFGFAVSSAKGNDLVPIPLDR